MWVKMKKNYIGPLGSFLTGLKHDLPESVVKQLPGGTWQKTVAPWDEQKDVKNCELLELKTQAANLQNLIDHELAQAKAKKELRERLKDEYDNLCNSAGIHRKELEALDKKIKALEKGR